MTHKVHQKIYRIKRIEDWNSRGFYGKKFPQYLKEDFQIREFLKKKLKEAMVEKILIERSQNKINIVIITARPGLIIGRGGEGVESLKKMLEKELIRGKKILKTKKIKDIIPEIKIEIKEIAKPWLSAALISQWMAQQIEKRVRYRQVLKRALGKIMANKEAKGARVEVTGRLDGIEIARKEWLKNGRLPRQTLRADIDYARDEAYCTYGVVGIKVWIYKGEKLE